MIPTSFISMFTETSEPTSELAKSNMSKKPAKKGKQTFLEQNLKNYSSVPSKTNNASKILRAWIPVTKTWTDAFFVTYWYFIELFRKQILSLK